MVPIIKTFSEILQFENPPKGEDIIPTIQWTESICYALGYGMASNESSMESIEQVVHTLAMLFQKNENNESPVDHFWSGLRCCCCPKSSHDHRDNGRDVPMS